MNTLETEIEIAVDGSVKLLSPLPAWVKPGRARAVLTLPEPSPASSPSRREIPKATPEVIARRLAALERLRARNPFGEIADPVAWQKEIRADVVQPGRE